MEDVLEVYGRPHDPARPQVRSVPRKSRCPASRSKAIRPRSTSTASTCKRPWGFGLRQIGVQEPLRPLRFSDGGSRQMIVMPVRVDAAPATAPVRPVAPAAASIHAAPDQPITTNPTPNQQPERNVTNMQIRAVRGTLKALQTVRL